MDLKRKTDRRAALLALHAWFNSQEINMPDAGYLCALVCGEAIGELAPSRESLERGLEILAATVREAAYAIYEMED